MSKFRVMPDGATGVPIAALTQGGLVRQPKVGVDENGMDVFEGFDQ